jgi:hypothetical protein
MTASIRTGEGAVRSDLRECVRSILRAAQREADEQLLAHRDAVEIGPPIVPAIREVVLGTDWSAQKPHGRLAAFTALMLAAHDADELGARELASEISRERVLPTLYRQRLASIGRFSRHDYEELRLCGLALFVSRDLRDATGPSGVLKKWLSGVPAGDLVGIARLYVTPRTQDRYWGEYLRVLSQIVLVWRSDNDSSARARLATEFTLYHEIGHHMHRAEDLTKGEAEDRADAYALARLRAAHPILRVGFLGRFAVSVVIGRTLRA